MSTTSRLFTSLIAVDADFKPAVHLPDHFNDEEQNAQLIRTYIPTTQSISFLAEVARSLNPASDQRARMLHGTFGTGKSDLLLMLCNYFSRAVDDPMMQPFYEKLRRNHEAQYTTIYQQRADKKPFLVVLLQANAVLPFPGFILHGLEQALKKAGLEALILPTRYSAARQKLEEWQHQHHPVLQSFTTTLRENEAMELPTLLNELAGAGADAVFAKFQRTFHAAAGTPFDIYTYDRPEETYKRVAQALREHGSHSGVLVVCDEFTEVLRRLARAGDQQSAEVEVEALGVQDLANTSVASGKNQLHFVVASLEPFASASADSPSDTASKAIEKFGGRFKSFALELQDSAELVRGAIRRLDATAVLPDQQLDELVETARPLWRQQPKQWVKDLVVEGCFPLHPLVTYALPLINGRVAQNNRTMFQFLKDNEGLGGFLAQQHLASPYPDWNNLLTLDWLFNYFEKSIQVRRSEVIDAYNHALQLLDRATVETALARRVLKIVAFCEVIAPALSPTRLLLRHALNLPPSAEHELLAALALLEQIEALYPPNELEGEASGAYSMPMAGRVNAMNLRQRVLRKARETQAGVAQLHARHAPEAVRAEGYNQRRGSFRELKATYVGLFELSSPTRLKTDLAAARDGLLWYVIASSESERSDAQSRARELTRQHARLVVAVPTLPLTVLEALKNYEALQAVRGDSSLDSGARTYLQDTGLVGKGFHSTLTATVTKLRDEKQWEWFREGSSQPNISGRAQAQELASKLMTAVYPQTPEQPLAQQFKAEGITPSLGRAMVELLKGQVQVSKGGSKPEDVIHRTAMTGLGLIKVLRSEGAFEVYGLTEPGSAQFNSQAIWQLYKSHLSAGKPWHKLIDTLRQPPYGLYDSLLFAFSGAFFTFYANAIELTAATGPQQALSLDEKLLKALIESPQSYTLRFQQLSGPEETWLHGVVSVGLKKPFDALGGQGKPLRARVAAQVRPWLAAQRLPLFAERLDAAQLAALLPTSPAPVLAAAVLLLRHQSDRSDEALAGALLKELPEALLAPADRSAWTSDSVQELLALWGETCRLVEQLAATLEQHAEHAVAAVFGCEQRPAAERWNHIFHWRANRAAVQGQAAGLLSNARELLAQTNKPNGSIREALLDSFARSVIGINTAYHTWSSLEQLDRLVRELQKAREEIDTRWRALATEEEVWYNGVASAAVGRQVAGVQADRTAQYLHEWATSVAWPGCALALNAAELQRLFPAVDAQGCADLGALLQRTQHSAEDWKRELGDALPRQFGVAGWTKDEVEHAVARLGAALKHAAQLDALLRKHTLAQAIEPFTGVDGGAASAGELLQRWQAAHPIPAEHDLDENATILLGQLASSADAETTLLITLPRALPQIAKSYQQWRSYAELERYVQTVATAAGAVEQYTPLTSVELCWLTRVVTHGLQRPFANQPREQQRLARAVAAQASSWLRDQQLPPFATSLAAVDAQELFPELGVPQVTALLTLLGAQAQLDADPASFFLSVLPRALAVDAASTAWGEATVEALVAELHTVCSNITNLNNVAARHIFAKIGPVFGVTAHEGGATALVAKLRAWRQAYVLFANEQLSSDATLLAELLAAPSDDPSNLLLATLPGRLRELRAPYGSWPSWEHSGKYVQALDAAAQEIAQRGEVSAATPRVQAHWAALKAQFAELSRDEQRWLIKAFSEEFRA